tara:strand:+ start:811 stop:2607 length:1797 start_codon:yes stop_codon:yes gene_type:complete
MSISTHSVHFDSSNVNFDLVAFSEISGEMTAQFTFKDIFFQKGFSSSDSSAVAVIDVSAADYNDLFKLNIPLFDPEISGVNVDTDHIRYFTNSSGWTDVSFSNADVSSGAIFNKHINQTVKKDFLRSMIKDITGGFRLNNLFKNQNAMINEIQDLDTSFNTEIRSVLSAIENAGWLTDADYGVLQDASTNYTFQGIFNNYSSGEDITDISSGYHSLGSSTFSKFNPLRILSSSILGENDSDETTPNEITTYVTLFSQNVALVNDQAFLSQSFTVTFDMTDLFDASLNQKGWPYVKAVTIAQYSLPANSSDDVVKSTILFALNTVYGVSNTDATAYPLQYNDFNKYLLEINLPTGSKPFLEHSPRTNMSDVTWRLSYCDTPGDATTIRTTVLSGTTQGNSLVISPSTTTGGLTGTSSGGIWFPTSAAAQGIGGIGYIQTALSFPFTIFTPFSGMELNNSNRREILIQSLHTQVASFWSDLSASDISFVSQDSGGTTYNVYMTQNAAISAGNTYSSINGSIFSSLLSNITLYADTSNVPALTNSNSLIRNVVDKEYSFPFVSGDNLHLLITYKPQSNTFSLFSSLPTINPRTYEIILRMN